jgi:predicted MFS family arabinose efflux permease
MGVYKLVHDAGIFIGPVLMGVILDSIGMEHAFVSASGIFLFGTLLLALFY